MGNKNILSNTYYLIKYSLNYSFMSIQKGECVVLRDRKLNIAPAIKKQSLCTTGAIYYTTQANTQLNSIPLDQYPAIYPPGTFVLYFYYY